MSTTIRLQNLTKRFAALGLASAGGKDGPPAQTVAVDNVTLTINAGELFFLLGPSGCGKTTLLRMIAGFIEPSAGTIMFDRVDPASGAVVSSRDITHVPPNKRNTGMVFQSYALWPHMTVAQNVAFGLGVRKVAGAERDRRVAEALEAVQMGQYAQRRPNQLSGGQQQRVALARALVIRPDVLLLDEPLSNLDAKLRIELRSEIRRICKESGITGVYVTHDQKEALSMADRVAIVRSGRIVQIGAPAELYRRPASKFVAEFLGETNFLDARIIERTGTGARLETPAGMLASAQVAPSVADDARDIVVSVRPEALRIGEGTGPDGNQIRGIAGTETYLGETAQLTVKLPSSNVLRVSRLNPREQVREGQAVSVAVDPADVVVLPRE